MLYPRIRFEAKGQSDEHTLHSIILVTLGSGAQWVIDPWGPRYGRGRYQAVEWIHYQEEWVAKSCQLTGPSWTDDMDEAEEYFSEAHGEIIANTARGYEAWLITLDGGETWWRKLHIDSFVAEDWRRAARKLFLSIRDAFH